MTGYSSFALYYDELTQNIRYDKLALRINELILRFGGKKNGILLDLACGTGSLSEEMARLGYDVIGVDRSEEMLSAAIDKKLLSGLDIQYLCQDMQKLDMFGTVDITLCTLDSLNHLKNIDAIRRTVKRVALFSEPEALFIFDMNTPRKHMKTLGNNTFVYETDNVFCIWQNEYFPESSDNRVDIALDFFEKDKDGRYLRTSEEFSEIALETDVIRDILRKAGFEISAEYDSDSNSPVGADTDRILFICKKIPLERNGNL